MELPAECWRAESLAGRHEGGGTISPVLGFAQSCIQIPFSTGLEALIASHSYCKGHCDSFFHLSSQGGKNGM